MKRPIIDVIIPAYNEEKSIGHVIEDIPDGLVRYILVCNNNSKDKTKEVALAAGAIVLDEQRKGYGSACLKGMAYIEALEDHPDIVVFLDGDYSDFPQQMPELIAPIESQGFEMVIGSRAMGNLQKGSMQPQQIFGNWLATTLIKLIYNYQFTDLGPFRAVQWTALKSLNMQDKDFGWTVEMQVKAAKMGLKCTEVPVDYKKRIGVSKVSGTVKGTLLAGHKILWTIFKLI
ncbi:MAG: glycosyltransferase family 2 protein [Saprospiraceae bacterium]|nr:glycosyltransferase family 2 protein [Saprospiraceae bacterium]